MTPEQNAQWQEAVMQAYPAPISDGQERTLEQWRNHRIAEAAVVSLLPEDERTAFLKGRLKDSRKRLTDWNLPEWTLEMRDYWVPGYTEPSPDFTFRCNVGLIGLQVRHSLPEEQAETHLRLLCGFLSRALRPLIEYAETNKYTELRQDLEGYYQICQLCESEGHYQESQRWLEIQNNFRPGWPPTSMRTRAPLLVYAFAKFVRRNFFQVKESGTLQSMNSQLLYLSEEYEGCSLPDNRIAQAFLEALEAECPPPEWLPQT
ncbi:MAG: hypothetical protein QM758_05700 [Armatimonas sp.]